MHHLFNEYEAMTSQALELSDKAEFAIRPILQSAQDSGMSMRDVESVVCSTIHAIIAEMVLRAAMNKRKGIR